MNKKIFLLLTTITIVRLAFGQTTTLTVDANDVLNSNNKIVAATSLGQSFFTGHQIGGGYANTLGIFRAMTDQQNAVNWFYDGLKYDGNSYATTYSVRTDGQGYFAGGINIGGSPLGFNQAQDSKLNIFNNSPTGTNLILSAEYSNSYRWRFNTVDRGNAIDLDITSSNSGDSQETILKLSPTYSGRPALILMDNWLTANNGNIGIGTTDNANWQLAHSIYKLAVGGGIIAESVTVKLQPQWPDYVFQSNYILKPLSKVKSYIDQNHHLPDMPSADQVEKDGLNLGEMNKLLTQKVEELTLYLIEKDKQLQQQQNQIDLINQQMKLIIKN